MWGAEEVVRGGDPALSIQTGEQPGMKVSGWEGCEQWFQHPRWGRQDRASEPRNPPMKQWRASVVIHKSLYV